MYLDLKRGFRVIYQRPKVKLRISISNFHPKTSQYITHALGKFNLALTKMLYEDTDVLLVPKPVSILIGTNQT